MQEEILVAETLIKGDIAKKDEHYEKLKKEHVELLKSVPNQTEVAETVSDRDRYKAWKESIRNA